ncbi:hypothetical protein F0U60_36325 [Archangium minus]|uniref:SMI1/KNR4 family protein n=1 Tax=Archangium minus TaxID=83450 RepID=A0ABY9X0Q9_9BACT|nr:hypothetical protein F0U60_36325 [Archangium minus]
MTNEEAYLLAAGKRPDWFVYPNGFARVVRQGILDLMPWHLMEAKAAREKARALAGRYPSRELFPFAYRQDNDDIACWGKGHGEQVLIIHDFASPGFELERVFPTFWDWFREAVEETIHWE